MFEVRVNATTRIGGLNTKDDSRHPALITHGENYRSWGFARVHKGDVVNFTDWKGVSQKRRLEQGAEVIIFD